jgi:hypothetical protein
VKIIRTWWLQYGLSFETDFAQTHGAADPSIPELREVAPPCGTISPPLFSRLAMVMFKKRKDIPVLG